MIDSGRAEQERARAESLQVKLDKVRVEGDALRIVLKATIAKRDSYKIEAKTTSKIIEVAKGGDMAQEMQKMADEIQALRPEYLE